MDIELNIPGTNTKSCNTLDLKNPFFRYTGQAPQAPPGTNTGSATDQYWNNLAAGKLVMKGNGLCRGMLKEIVVVSCCAKLFDRQTRYIHAHAQTIIKFEVFFSYLTETNYIDI